VSEHLTIKDVQDYIWDREAADNQLELDLTFSPDEITQAFKRAARSYNSIPPLVGNADPAALPADTNLFLDATVMHLYIARMSNMQRNDLNYTAGGVTVELDKSQIAYMEKMIPFHRKLFEDAAKAQKMAINIRRGYGRVG